MAGIPSKKHEESFDEFTFDGEPSPVTIDGKELPDVLSWALTPEKMTIKPVSWPLKSDMGWKCHHDYGVHFDTGVHFSKLSMAYKCILVSVEATELELFLPDWITQNRRELAESIVKAGDRFVARLLAIGHHRGMLRGGR